MDAESTLSATGQRVRTAETLMLAFSDRTGVTPARIPGQRYLWTDAFAVCNFLALHRATGSPAHLARARLLVSHVHEVLGRQRPDATRSGWISGLGQDEGRRHPTRGGLRIGKPLPERRADEPFDEHLEWERDGQYFHYLTRWMHALARMAHATRETCYLEWAVELAEAAHTAFTFTRARDGRRQMHWKMSVDLTRPLVASMGHHDPLDGMITCLELQAALCDFPLPGAAARLDAILDDLRTVAGTTNWTTDDPLGVGGLLAGACVLAQARIRRPVWAGCSVLELLECAAAGVETLHHRHLLARGRHRLAFRELGLAIGLHAVPRIASLARQHVGRIGGGALARVLDQLEQHLSFGTAIEEFWLAPANRVTPQWAAHRDINDVMLATSLVPAGYLEA